MISGAPNLIALLINGLSEGILLALLGVGITLIFGLGGILNLAIGVFVVLAVISAVELHSFITNPWLAASAGVLVIGTVGLGIDRTLLSLIYRSEGEERTRVGIFATLGLALFIEGFLFLYYPSRYSLPVDLPSYGIGSVIIPGSTIVTIIAGILLLGLFYLFLTRTYIGNATQTVLQDEQGAVLCGIKPRRVYSIVFILSTMTAAIVGILIGMDNSVVAADSLGLTIDAVIVSVVGGVNNLTGTIVAGLLLGMVVTLAGAFVGAYVSEVILLLIAVGALIIKPEQIT